MHAARQRGTVQMDVEDREKDADPHGRPADELVVLQVRDLGHRAVGRRNHQPRLLRHPPRRIAEEIHDKPPGPATARRQRPDTNRHQRPGTVSANSGQPINCNSARPQRANGSRPRQRNGSSASAHQQPHRLRQYFRSRGSRISCGASWRVALAQGGHAGDVAGAEVRQTPSPPAAPGQFDPVTNPAARLHAADILRQRFRRGAIRRWFSARFMGSFIA